MWIPKLYKGKNRTFFSYTYEIMNDYSQGFPLITTVPTLAQQTGDFSALLEDRPAIPDLRSSTTWRRRTAVLPATFSR